MGLRAETKCKFFFPGGETAFEARLEQASSRKISETNQSLK
jgi:hypothetical protein